MAGQMVEFTSNGGRPPGIWQFPKREQRNEEI